MFTRLGAGYNRCPVVPLWSGLSGGLLPLQATTRCSRVYRRLAVSGKRLVHARRSSTYRSPLTAHLLLAALLLPAQLASQAVPAPDTVRPPVVPPKKLTAPQTSHPEVVNLTLKGVKVVRQDDLRNNIYTTASYCNSFILQTFCWFSKSKNFYTRKYLDHQELQRDVLSVPVFYWKRVYLYA